MASTPTLQDSSHSVYSHCGPVRRATVDPRRYMYVPAMVACMRAPVIAPVPQAMLGLTGHG